MPSLRRAVLLGLILTAIVFSQSRPLTLEEIFAEPGLEGPAPEQIRWSPDGRTLTYILARDASSARDLWAFDIDSGSKRILLDSETLAKLAPPVDEAASDERERERLRRYSVASYIWSHDSTALLLNGGGRLHYFRVGGGSAQPIAPEKSGVRDPKFSPDSQWVSFVYRHDLWLAPVTGGPAQQITEGGSPLLLNGDLDWVYPEELGIRSGYSWSPGGDYIAFLQLNLSRVPTYPITNFAPIHPAVDMQRYPKAGDPNPAARAGVIRIRGGGRASSPDWLEHDAEYVARIDWMDNERVVLQLLNRAQTDIRLDIYDARRARLERTLLAERNLRWISLHDDLRFLARDEVFLWSSERSGFRHLYLYGYDGSMRRQLTDGNWEVKSLAGVNEATGRIYYVANQGNPMGADLHEVSFLGAGARRLTAGEGTRSIVMNKQGSAWAETFSSLTSPGGTDVVRRSDERRSELHRHRQLTGRGLAEPELMEIEAVDGALIRVMLLRPETLPEGGKAPLVVYVYGGPRAPVIRDAWDRRGRYLFHQRLVQQGYAVAYIDDRASSLLGQVYESAIARNYGPLALEDQLFALERLKALDFVDPGRIAIWGWSGGGFATCFAMTHSDVFRAGVAVAPVTDWYLYDSIYTERYMGLPSDSLAAYERTSPLKAAAKLEGRLLLAHGDADDNVHIQNTMRMVDALVDAGKPYDLLVYPGKTHGLSGAKTRVHLFRSIEEFLARELETARKPGN